MSEEQNFLERIRRLELIVDQLRRRLDGLEETVGGLDEEIRQINEGEEIVVTS
jgi:hypothetical protein